MSAKAASYHWLYFVASSRSPVLFSVEGTSALVSMPKELSTGDLPGAPASGHRAMPFPGRVATSARPIQGDSGRSLRTSDVMTREPLAWGARRSRGLHTPQADYVAEGAGGTGSSTSPWFPHPSIDASCERRGAYEKARYGYRAVRIGQARHPGPSNSTVVFRRAREEMAQGHHLLPAPENTPLVQPVHAARRAAQVVLDLARRCLDHQTEDVPRPLLRQTWSDLNVPLIKAAASNSQSHAILDWLETAGATPQPVQTRNVGTFVNVGVREAWAALRDRLRAWGISCIADLAHWLRSQGFHAVLPLQYFGKRAQEFILDKATNEDLRACGLEMGYARATVALMTRPGLVREALANLEMRQLPGTADHSQQQPLQQSQNSPPQQARQPPEPQQPPHTGWVPITNLTDLDRCVRLAEMLRPHVPAHAEEEMRRAGVGAAALESSASSQANGRRARAPPAGVGVAPRDHACAAPSAPRRGRGNGRPVDGESARLPAEPPREAWARLDEVNLREEFLIRCPLLQSCPRFMRGRYRHAQRIALDEADTAARTGDATAECRAWKLFGLLSRLLLHRPQSEGHVGKKELEQRCEAFARGEWLSLLASAQAQSRGVASKKNRSASEERRRRQESALAKIRLEECGKARQVLTSSAVAPGTRSTREQLDSRPQRLSEELPADVVRFVPEAPVDVPFASYVRTLKSAPRGSAGGPGDTTNEHLKIALDDEDTAVLMHRAVLRLARAEVPEDIADAFMSARMTALVKPNGGIRGIATGTSFRRLVAGCLAGLVGPEVEAACAPYQYAMSTRAGTECVAHLFRAACDMDAQKCVLSIDGIGAFDHVKRASMLRKLLTLPKARAILPFVRLSYANPTRYAWTDENGRAHEIRQGEGGEQGDPLVPLFFALGIHDALHEVAQQLQEGEDLCAFLDDVYALCSPARVRPIYDLLGEALLRHAGIELHAGKTKVWNRAGVKPPRVDDIGREGAWSPEGVIILGSPVGTASFVAAQADLRLQDEVAFMKEIALLPDPQSAWQLFCKCAVPRGNYWLRTLPPSLSEQYAARRDEVLWKTAVQIFGMEAVAPEQLERGKRIAQLPARLGGLGVRSSLRCRQPAYWASWADSLEMIQKRNP